MSEMWQPDDDDSQPGLGRPRPESPQLMIAKQLVNAYVTASSAEDREYAANDAESFMLAAGDEVEMSVLIVMLGLPAADLTQRVRDLVAEKLRERLPAAVALLLRAVIGQRGPRRDNAATLLTLLSTADLAAGYIAILAGEHDAALKKAAAVELVALGKAAAGPIFEALADGQVRSWILQASGCAPGATDAEILRQIVGAP